MTGLNYCANGCTFKLGDDWYPVETEGNAIICGGCEKRLRSWLRKIPETYLELGLFLEHGAVEKNPESKTTRSAEAQAPMRLEIVDLLDHRRGRRWNGTEPATDRRGVAGWLKIHLDTLIEERPLTQHGPITSIATACDLLDRHLMWIAEQTWAPLIYDDMRNLHRALSDAVGEYRRPPVGRCRVQKDDAICGGPLYPSDYNGVRCAACGDITPEHRLRILGSALKPEAAS